MKLTAIQSYYNFYCNKSYSLIKNCVKEEIDDILEVKLLKTNKILTIYVYLFLFLWTENKIVGSRSYTLILQSKHAY